MITNAILPLFLSDVSGTEVLVIFLFILIFFGSKSIPTMARTFGRAMREVRNASADLQNEIKKSGLDSTTFRSSYGRYQRNCSLRKY